VNSTGDFDGMMYNVMEAKDVRQEATA